MSFRVWFLRMVWIVAAAVALSGCDNGDEEDKNGGGNGGGNGDGPSLAVTLDKSSADVDATADAAHDVKVTVAITSDDAADKKAKVTLTVTCDPDTVEVTAPDAKDATDGSVTWDEVSVPLGVAAKCTFKAEAELGGEKKHNSAMFEVKDASGGPAVTLVFGTVPASLDISDGDGLQNVAVNIHHDGSVASSATDEVTLSLSCTPTGGNASQIDLDTNDNTTMDLKVDAVSGVATFLATEMVAVTGWKDSCVLTATIDDGDATTTDDPSITANFNVVD